MIADVTSILFYVFASILMLAALAVITAKNPVHSVFFLILAFFNAAGLFVLLGAEYIAMTLVIVYVGAVAVLFLFVVMMLNINFEKLRAGFTSHLPVGVGVAVVLFAELASLLYGSILSPAPLAEASSPIPDAANIDNAKAIGRVLYTDYLIAFQLAGVILLVSMIGAIVLTHRQRLGVKRQNIAKQLARTREEAVVMVNVKPGEGI
ncbi:MAG: NADH-quinone oxidoreductase subunit J [Rickettsiales bacterium]|nr:NADH-quinone oxidoreductase subunit J [Rickettsiales bacterium]